MSKHTFSYLSLVSILISKLSLAEFEIRGFVWLKFCSGDNIFPQKSGGEFRELDIDVKPSDSLLKKKFKC
ncbi:hypothetical protein QQP08_005586 [Theobroma cacao]|nr:hypothetical protein QQP08_005586 [Theobroma cacao]